MDLLFFSLARIKLKELSWMSYPSRQSMTSLLILGPEHPMF